MKSAERKRKQKGWASSIHWSTELPRGSVCARYYSEKASCKSRDRREQQCRLEVFEKNAVEILPLSPSRFLTFLQSLLIEACILRFRQFLYSSNSGLAFEVAWKSEYLASGTISKVRHIRAQDRAAANLGAFLVQSVLSYLDSHVTWFLR